MVLTMCNPTLMHRTVPDGVDISAEYMFDNNLFEDSPISAFFRGKIIFLTGGTGFLGHLFIEKCIRAGVKWIYVLCRPKSGKCSQDRLRELLTKPIFTKLNSKNPLFRARVKLVNGDLNLQHLGLSPEDEVDLINHVEIVIHAAIDKRPDQELLSLVDTNLCGTKKLLNLCERMNKLQLFVHISSVYAHSAAVSPQNNNGCVKEIFYQPKLDAELLISLAENTYSSMDKEHLNELTSKIISPWPNSYLFTKSLAEDLIRQYSDRIPVTIVRPSIIISTWEDPMPGWSNCAHDLNGLLSRIIFGYVRCIKHNSEVNLDVICADFVINSTIAIIYDVCKTKSTSQLIPKPKIFHITSGSQNLLNTDKFISSLVQVSHEVPALTNFWYSSVYIARSDIEYKIISLFLHYIPAQICDFYLKYILNKKPYVLEMYREFHDKFNLISFYHNLKIKFENLNAVTVYNRMTDYDKNLFPNDIKNLFWKQYCYEYAMGARLYVCDESFDTMELARARNTKQKWIQYLIWTVLYSGILFMIYFIFVTPHFRLTF